MKDLILKGRTIPYNKKSFTPTIHASAKRNLIEITHLQGFTKIQLLKFKQWVADYNASNTELLTVSYIPMLPSSHKKRKYGYIPNIHSTLVPAFPYHRVKYLTKQGLLSIHSILKNQQLMYNIRAAGGAYYPEIVGLTHDDFLKISGESYHSYTTEFYAGLFDWFEFYLNHKQPTKFRLEFWMTYFNTSSSRKFLELLTRLEKYQQEQNLPYGNITVYWYYEENDVDMEETGEEYQEDLALNFEFIPI